MVDVDGARGAPSHFGLANGVQFPNFRASCPTSMYKPEDAFFIIHYGEVACTRVHGVPLSSAFGSLDQSRGMESRTSLS